MRRRVKLSRRGAKKNFRRGMKVKGKNYITSTASRGGIRL